MACSRPAAGLAILYACAGRRGDARSTLGAVKALAQKEFVSLYGIASYYAVTGDNDCALDWLNKAYSERDGTLVWLKVHPRLDGLRASGLGDGMICRYLDGNANQSGRYDGEPDLWEGLPTDLWVMSAPVCGYVVNNQARVATQKSLK
jgi:hypothetical protein